MNRTLWLVCFSLVVFSSTVPTGAQNVDMGPTYHELDTLVTRLVVVYDRATVVVERGPTGLEATVETPAGLPTLWIRANDDLAVVEFGGPALGGGHPHLVDELPFDARSTDWLALQSYSLWTDLIATGHHGSPMSWQGRLLRLQPVRDDSPGAGTEHLARLRQAEISIRAEIGSFVVESVRHPAGAVADAESRTFTASFTTRLFDARTGEKLGLLRKFDRERVVVWDFPSASSGWLSDETVPGGWTFDHNMAWANIQSAAFLLLRKDRLESTASSSALAPRSADWTPLPGARRTLDPLWGGPRALAGGSETCDKEPDGCTGLHALLDGTIYEECCNRHDTCYYHPDYPCCTAWSWILLDPRWRCIQCNLEALWCFFTSGPSGGFDDSDPCSVPQGGWCPAECFTCTYQAY